MMEGITPIDPKLYDSGKTLRNHNGVGSMVEIIDLAINDPSVV